MQLKTSHSSILNETALGQKQTMNKDLRENLNTHDVTKAIEQGNEVNLFSFYFLKKSENKKADFFPQSFFEEKHVLTLNFLCSVTDTYLWDHTP